MTITEFAAYAYAIAGLITGAAVWRHSDRGVSVSKKAAASIFCAAFWPLALCAALLAITAISVSISLSEDDATRPSEKP